MWDRYHELTGRRRAGSLDPTVHAELVRLTGAVEADRAAALAALAAVRGRTLAGVVDDLGLAPAAG